MLNFEPNHYLSDEEMWGYWNEPNAPGATILLHVCEQSAPGVAMALPIWGGSQLARLDDGDVIERIPDQSRMDDFGQLIYRGNNLTESAITELVVDLIVRQQLEVPVAFAFHFDSAPFGEAAKSMETLRSRFWSKWSGFSPTHRITVDEQLRHKSQAYATILEFLSEPRNPRFQGLLDSAVNASDLSLLYEIV